LAAGARPLLYLYAATASRPIARAAAGHLVQGYKGKQKKLEECQIVFFAGVKLACASNFFSLVRNVTQNTAVHPTRVQFLGSGEAEKEADGERE
jgi:hypothetical protein